MKKAILTIEMALAGTLAAETFTWTGAQDGFWTNAANWTVEGVAAERCPGVVGDVSNLTEDIWLAWTNNIDRAYFAAAEFSRFAREHARRP